MPASIPQQIAELQTQLETLLVQDNVSVEELEKTALIYQQCLDTPQPENLDTTEYAAFLQQNLDWLHTFIDKLSAAKLAVAAELLTIQKGKKAKQGYGQNN